MHLGSSADTRNTENEEECVEGSLIDEGGEDDEICEAELDMRSTGRPGITATQTRGVCAKESNSENEGEPWARDDVTSSPLSSCHPHPTSSLSTSLVPALMPYVALGLVWSSRLLSYAGVAFRLGGRRRGHPLSRWHAFRGRALGATGRKRIWCRVNRCLVCFANKTQLLHASFSVLPYNTTF